MSSLRKAVEESHNLLDQWKMDKAKDSGKVPLPKDDFQIEIAFSVSARGLDAGEKMSFRLVTYAPEDRPEFARDLSQWIGLIAMDFADRLAHTLRGHTDEEDWQ